VAIMTRTEIAEKLYEAYTASSGGLNYQGLPCPTWGELPDAIRKHWTAAADEARMRHTGRLVERKTMDGWKEVRLENLKKHDVFRMFESDGALVDGIAEMVAEEDAYLEHGTSGIKLRDTGEKEIKDNLSKAILFYESQNQKVAMSMPDVRDFARLEYATRQNKNRIALLRLLLESFVNTHRAL